MFAGKLEGSWGRSNGNVASREEGGIAKVPPAFTGGTSKALILQICLALAANLFGGVGGRGGIVTGPARAAIKRCTFIHVDRRPVEDRGVAGLFVVRHTRRHDGAAPANGFGIQFRVRSAWA